MRMNKLRTSAIGMACCIVCVLGHAQVRPDAGQIMRQAQPEAPQKAMPSHATLPTGSSATVTSAANEATDAATIDVREVQITGATLFSVDELRAVLGDFKGQRRFSQLQDAAIRITHHYSQAGYLLARAYLPKQSMEGGILKISVLEGHLADVVLDNSSRQADQVLQRWFTQLQSVPQVRSADINRKLLLLSDSPGIGAVTARLVPGAAVGESVMAVNVEDAPRWTGQVLANNYGGLYNGRAQAGAVINSNNAMGWGEQWGINALASEGQLLSGQVSLNFPISTDGARVWTEAGHTRYTLGDSFASLNASGTSNNVNLALSYPLLRSESKNLSVRVGGQHQALHDSIGSTHTQTDKSSDALNLRLQGDARTVSGVTLMGLGLGSGHLSINSASAAALDAAAAKTAGNFQKLSWNLEHQQYVGSQWLVLASARGQQASKNLDSSEKFSLGGPAGVRAYAVGEATGDEGWLLTLEARYNLGNNLVLSAFYDQGHTSVNKNPYLTSSNGKDRSGGGFGVKGSWGQLDWNTTLAWRGNQVGTAEPDKSLRAWVQASWRL